MHSEFGLSLADRLSAGTPLTAVESLHIGAELAAVVARAHERGVAHGALNASCVQLESGRVSVEWAGHVALDVAAEDDVLSIARIILQMFGVGDEVAVDRAAERLAATGVPPATRALLLSALGPRGDRPTAAELRDTLAASAMALQAGERGGARARTGSFFAELSRRRVIRTGLWYGGAAVAIVEAADLFLPSLGAPPGTTRLLAILAVCGFPVALALAWAFDIMPAHTADAHAWRRGTLVAMVAGASLLAAVVLLRRPPNDDGSNSDTPTLFAASPSHVAVLAFNTIGGDDRLAAFASHLQSRLIDGLSVAAAGASPGTRPLRVASLATVLPFSFRTVSVDSIRRALGVGTLLEGTVEPAPGSVRVRVRLIDTETGDQLATSLAQANADDYVVLLDAVADSVLRLIRMQLGPIVRERTRLLETRDTSAFHRVVWANRRLEDFDPALRRRDYTGAQRVLDDADSLFAEAERFDGEWVEPILERARLSKRAVRLAAARGTDAAESLIEHGIAHIERALAVRSDDPRALELRGDLHQLWIQVAPPESPVDRARLIDAAERDLRAALIGNPTPAKALRILSELASATGRMQEALDYGLRAYEADPFLEQIDFTVFRLFEYSFALERDSDAARWCGEGRRRFTIPVFHDCRLSLAAWSNAYPLTADSAWAVVTAQLAEYPAPLRPRLEPRLHAMAAAILARAGAADSALAVLREARRRDDGTSGMYRAAAGVYAILGMPDSALAAVRALLDADPSARAALGRTPELRGLKNDIRFLDLIRSVRNPEF